MARPASKNRLLFVCLGNICRSPAAEGIMKHIIEQKNLSGNVVCDSAGTSAYHEGEPADSRMQASARKRGYQLTSRARAFDPEQDFDDFDLILTMDEANYHTVLGSAPEEHHHNKVHKIISYCTQHDVFSVPDPYMGGEEGFELVLDILEDACGNLLKEVEKSND